MLTVIGFNVYTEILLQGSFDDGAIMWPERQEYLKTEGHILASLYTALAVSLTTVIIVLIRTLNKDKGNFSA